MEEIQIHIERPVRGIVEIRVKGRIDSSGSGRLNAALEEEIRAGSYRIGLNLAEVNFLSSAGIRVLLTFHKQLRELGGGLDLLMPSENVRKVLDLAGLSQLLLTVTADGEPQSEISPGTPVREPGVRENLVTEILNPGAGYRCMLWGQQSKLALSKFTEADVRDLPFPAHTLGLGLGAMGGDFNDCRERFGEFLAVGGAAVYLPTDKGGKPDYSVLTGQLIPEVKALYALHCEGSPSHQVRFEAERTEDWPLSTLLMKLAEMTPAPSKAVIILAESKGLVGAALRSSPLSVPSLFSFPEVRETLSFTTEPAFANCLTLMVGIISRETKTPLATFLRPLKPGSEWLAHLHAAAFPYRPLKKEGLQLEETVQQLVTNSPILGLLHLMYDDRELVGLGESRVLQGSCWIGDLLEVRADGRNEL
ncbi:MAG: STAS domain-containing protein [Bacillota bacterium]